MTERVQLGDLSDHELSNMDLSKVALEDETPEEPTDNSAEEPEEEANVEVAPEQADTSDDTEEDDDGDEGGEASPQTDEALQAEEQTPENQELEPNQAEPKKESKTDYKGFYEQVTATFKANGIDMQVSNPADIISLMQKGANYAKKLESLKPSMRVIRTLQNHKIGEEDLSFLIDLHNKQPEAIARLIKDSGQDAYSLDEEKSSQYASKVQLATDAEVELDNVVQELTASSSTFSDTLNHVANSWDVASRQHIADNPNLLRIIDQHHTQGYFQVVLQEMARLKTLGYLQGVTDLQAYQQVGEMLNKQGRFNTAPTPKPAPVAPKPATPAPSVKDKRKAAGSPRPTVNANAPAPIDLSQLSDEEILAQFK